MIVFYRNRLCINIYRRPNNCPHTCIISEVGIILFSVLVSVHIILIILSVVIIHTIRMQEIDMKLKNNRVFLETRNCVYFSARFSPSVTASFLAFSRDSALDLRPSLTPQPTSSWNEPSCNRHAPHLLEIQYHLTALLEQSDTLVLLWISLDAPCVYYVQLMI